MKTIVTLMLCPNGPMDPVAEIRMVDPAAVPSIGDVVQFDPEAEGEDGEFCGKVVRRIFHQLPYHLEIDVFAEPS
jgi:hypothetical protein